MTHLHHTITSLSGAGSGREPLPLDRSASGFHHLGDLTLRVRRAATSEPFRRISTVSSQRDEPLASATSLTHMTMAAGGAVVSLDASACLRPPSSTLRLQRRVEVQRDEARLVWTIGNVGAHAVELGGVGFSMPFNQMFSGRRLQQACCSRGETAMPFVLVARVRMCTRCTTAIDQEAEADRRSRDDARSPRFTLEAIAGMCK